jgi:hypothetical protein
VIIGPSQGDFSFYGGAQNNVNLVPCGIPGISETEVYLSPVTPANSVLG